jgi:hypothetical protein
MRHADDSAAYLSAPCTCNGSGNAPRLSRMAKRGYSREFKPHGDTGKRYLLDEIPAGLWRDVREKAKREGVSIRALILTLLERWLRGHP